MWGYVIYSLGTALCPRGRGKYIDLPGLKAKLLLTRIYNSNQTMNLYSTNQLTLEHIHVTFEGKAT